MTETSDVARPVVMPTGRIKAIQWNNRIKTLLLMTWFILAIMLLSCLVVGVVTFVATGFDFAAFKNTFFSSNSEFRLLRFFLKFLGFIFLGAYLFLKRDIDHIERIFDARNLPMAASHPFYRELETLCISRGLKVPSLYLMNMNSDLVMAAVVQGFSRDWKLILSKAAISLPEAEQKALLAQAVQRIYSKDAFFFTIFCFFGYFPFHVLQEANKFSRMALRPFLFIVDIFMAPIRPLILNLRMARMDAGSLELTKDKQGMLDLMRHLAGKEALIKYYYEAYLALFIMQTNSEYRKSALDQSL
jgi:hypothetical protein